MSILRAIGLVAGLAVLAACDTTVTPPPVAVAPKPVRISEASESLRNYYAHVQSDLVTRGLLRTDGGGPDTPFTPDMLARNFERIAFYDEYAIDSGLRASSGRAGQLRRWAGPVRMNVEFGPSVPEAQRATDRQTLQAYIPRLARVTGHSISQKSSRANFHVLVMGEDDKSVLETRIKQIVPGASTSTLNLFRNIPKTIHCLVVAFSSETNAGEYNSAIALIRAEHPDILRKSCIHEELAQGLGLANDSPEARPSIFNDDDEFAYLTTHDEMLLAILYDSRLAIGMDVDRARPVVRILAREQAGRIY
ncbi:DUF2927 domain-containing protein [Shimia sp.]|uniref:DUF2927 domain-containing protein n=1 Tax=Shimia sp. TaxID=1954381 RepID=UPI0032985E0C